MVANYEIMRMMEQQQLLYAVFALLIVCACGRLFAKLMALAGFVVGYLLTDGGNRPVMLSMAGLVVGGLTGCMMEAVWRRLRHQPRQPSAAGAHAALPDQEAN